MNRYIRANETIHAPAKLKKTVSAAKSHRPMWLGATAVVTAAAITLAVLFWPGPADEPAQNNFPVNNPLISVANAAEVLASPTYPEMAQAPDFEAGWDQEAYDAWQSGLQTQWQLRPEDDSALDQFYYDTAREFLFDAGSENRLYSPLNLYLALGMLAEVTDGASSAQVLDVLNCASLEELRDLVSGLWNVNYRDDGAVTSLLSSSIWLRDDTAYNMDTMQTLADTYYASSYSGTMGSEALNGLYRDWLNEATGNLLSGQINELELDADTVLSLASAIYFEASWSDKFAESKTEPDIFHAPSGDVTVDFLNQKAERNYYWGEDFSAVSLSLTESGKMWILLPDKDSSVDELLSGDALELVIDPSSWKNREYLSVILSIPKFDVSSQTDLTDGLKNLGVTDVFDWNAADFSPVCENSDGLVLSNALHGARVSIDEDGCLGAAYTVLTVEATVAPTEMDRVEFTADRPFLFAITGWDGQILFLGVVNQP